MNITLKCPDCGALISAASMAGIEQKTAECPTCHTKQQLGAYLPKLSLAVGSHTYQLHFGKQWVGRLKEGNDAEIQIPDDTRYMSRHHAIINVQCTATGLRCTLEEHGKNPTLLQGIELCEDDIVYLNANDCLTLGEQQMYVANDFAK